MIKKKKLDLILLTIALIITAVLLHVSTPVFAQEKEAVILFDGSGSMKGFYNTKSINNINDSLFELLSGFRYDIDSSVFVTLKGLTDLYPLPSFLDQPQWGNETRIDEALSLSKGKQLTIIITDNVQDVGENSYASVRAFYNMLEKESIYSVILLPLRKPFDGRLYFERNRYPDQHELLERIVKQNPGDYTFTRDSYESRRYNTVWMKGDKALAVYLVFSDIISVKQMNKLMRSIEKIFDTKPFMVKPIDQGKFFIKGVNDKQHVKEWFGNLEKRCLPQSSGRFNLTEPNLYLMPPPTGIYQPVRKGMEKFYQLAAFKSKNRFQMEKSNLLRFYFSLGHKAQSITIGDPDNECSKDVRIGIESIEYRLPAAYREYFSSNQNIKGMIIPQFIPGVIVAASDELASENNVPVFWVGIRTPVLIPIFSLKSLFGFAFVNSVPLVMNGNIKVTVPPEYFSLRKDYEEHYFTYSELDQTRIYTPENIVNYISSKPITLNFEFVSKSINFVPPLYIKIPFYGFLTIILLLTALILFSMKTRYFLMFEDTGKAIEIYLPVPFTQKVYKRNGLNVFYINRGFLSYVIRSVDNHTLEVKGAPSPSVKLGNSTSFHVKGANINTVVETITYRKYSTLEHEKLSDRKRIKKTDINKEKKEANTD